MGMGSVYSPPSCVLVVDMSGLKEPFEGKVLTSYMGQFAAKCRIWTILMF